MNTPAPPLLEQWPDGTPCEFYSRVRRAWLSGVVVRSVESSCWGSGVVVRTPDYGERSGVAAVIYEDEAPTMLRAPTRARTA